MASCTNMLCEWTISMTQQNNARIIAKWKVTGNLESIAVHVTSLKTKVPLGWSPTNVSVILDNYWSLHYVRNGVSCDFKDCAKIARSNRSPLLMLHKIGSQYSNGTSVTARGPCTTMLKGSVQCLRPHVALLFHSCPSHFNIFFHNTQLSSLTFWSSRNPYKPKLQVRRLP